MNARYYCTDYYMIEEYIFNFKRDRNHVADISNVDIDYNACTNNSLEDRFDELQRCQNVKDGAEELFEKYIEVMVIAKARSMTGLQPIKDKE